MNAAPKGLYPLSSKAVITLSALDSSFHEPSRQRQPMPNVNPNSLENKNGLKQGLQDADVRYTTCRFGLPG